MSKAKLLMIQGTSSGSGKTTLVTAFCRIFSNKGYRVAPFKAQNMSSSAYNIKSTSDQIALAQAIQAIASRKNPDARMNPVLLKPLGNYRSLIILGGKLYDEMHAKEYYEKFILQKGFPLTLKGLESLRKENDLVIIEGAGSPAEVNILKYDVANMLLAHKVRAPVVITSDIERGGCFASIVGTMELLKPIHRRLVKGFIINKFRGDKSLLKPAMESVKKITRRQFFGIIPRVDFCLPNEDSLDGQASNRAVMSEGNWDRQISLIAKTVQKSIDIQNLSTNVIGLSK
jgi:adenosylcobyric acid synthase